MPAVSPAQQRFMGMELNAVRHGKKSSTGMSEQQLSDFAHKPAGGFASVKPMSKGKG